MEWIMKGHNLNTKDGNGQTADAQPDPLPAVALLDHPSLLRKRDYELAEIETIWGNGLVVAQVYVIDHVDDPWGLRLLVVDEKRAHALVYVDDDWQHCVRVGDLIAFRVWHQPFGQMALIADYRRTAVA
jgi:hypothetical protein